MFNPDDEMPRQVKKTLRDLAPMSVEELRTYIAEMEQEIARVEEAITKKEAHRAGIDALFGRQ